MKIKKVGLSENKKIGPSKNKKVGCGPVVPHLGFGKYHGSWTLEPVAAHWIVKSS